MSRWGWCLAQAGRLIGAPLPTKVEAGVPCVVTITQDRATGAQNWTRLYAGSFDLPHITCSAKRFAGPTGLEEYIGRGIGMALLVSVEDAALVFRSAGFFLQILGYRLRLPRPFRPGDLMVTHREAGSGAFVFTLEIVHPRFGTLVRQAARFRECRP